jgi:hypothetical protein
MKFVKFSPMQEPASKFLRSPNPSPVSFARTCFRRGIKSLALSTRMDIALKENNHIASTFLQWFVTEQLEEVSSLII